MPIYEYQTLDTGEIVEDLRPASQAVAVGEITDVAGRPARRIASMIRTERRFAGSECVSYMEGCAPDEVPELRRIVGDNGKVREDGTVEFSSRGEQRRYTKRLNEYERASAALDQAMAAPAPTPKKVPHEAKQAAAEAIRALRAKRGAGTSKTAGGKKAPA